MILPQYYFLFLLAGIWIIIASIRDLRVREVPNWLNFSLVGFALAYRAFYSAEIGNWNFLLFGVLGFIVFFGLGNLFYYSRVFAGGDAKLLMGLGAVLPFESYFDLIFVSLAFIVLLFTLGSAYSLIYSVFIVLKNQKLFKKEFSKNIRKNWMIVLLLVVLFGIFSFILIDRMQFLIFGMFVLLLAAYLYVKSLDACMIKLAKPQDLTEGDWLVGDVRIGGKVIKKTVHGLSFKDILLIRRAGKKVYIKEGVPFVPAFLFAFIFMVFAYSNGWFLKFLELFSLFF